MNKRVHCGSNSILSVTFLGHPVSKLKLTQRASPKIVQPRLYSSDNLIKVLGYCQCKVLGQLGCFSFWDPSGNIVNGQELVPKVDLKEAE